MPNSFLGNLIISDDLTGEKFFTKSVSLEIRSSNISEKESTNEEETSIENEDYDDEYDEDMEDEDFEEEIEEEGADI